MKHGNWIPISKAFMKELPKNRPYTRLEAALSLQLDHDAGNPVTINGYSSLWSWSRKKVRRFLKQMNVKIIYPENTQKIQNQKGQIRVQIRDRYDEKKGQIRLVDSKGLQDLRDRYDKKRGQIRDRSGDTTRDPNPNPKDIYPFSEVQNAYNSILGDVLPKCLKMTDGRKKALKARWNEKHITNDGELRSDSLEYWQRYFEYVKTSRYLTGQVNDWKANFDWLINKSNFIKVIEETYN
jgi:hypothetical protein